MDRRPPASSAKASVSRPVMPKDGWPGSHHSRRAASSSCLTRSACSGVWWLAGLRQRRLRAVPRASNLEWFCCSPLVQDHCKRIKLLGEQLGGLQVNVRLTRRLMNMSQ